MPASIADHDRPHAGTVPAVAVPTPIGVAVPITVPEFAPVTIAITMAIVIIIPVETARAAVAIVAKLATYAFDLLDDAQMVLRRPNIGRTGQADRVGTVGHQRGADERYGGRQRHQQEPVHFSSSF
jgi:hypothetical protein